MDLGLRSAHVEMHGQGRVAFATRLRDHGVAHRVDRIGERDDPPDLFEPEDAHQARIFRSVSRLTFRPERTATAGPRRDPAFPVRMAATATAPDGSTRY